MVSLTDIHSLTDFQRNAKAYLERIRRGPGSPRRGYARRPVPRASDSRVGEVHRPGRGAQVILEDLALGSP